jgi:tRNA (adenine37-N6)-methyltransferase
MTYTVRPVGWVVGERGEALDDDWGATRATVRFDATRFSDECLAGLEEFSHLEVVFLFHKVAEDDVETAARRPRGNPDWPPVGIFAQRGRRRTNRLAVSRCRLVSITGLDVVVEGLDAVDGTPVPDVKPYMVEFVPAVTLCNRHGRPS